MAPPAGTCPQDTDAFCRGVLTSPDVVDYVNANFVSWAGDVTASDAFVVRPGALGTGERLLAWWDGGSAEVVRLQGYRAGAVSG